MTSTDIFLCEKRSNKAAFNLYRKARPTFEHRRLIYSLL